MRFPYPLALLLAAFAIPAVAADKNELPADVLAILDKADTMELFSLEPTDAKDGFRGYKVLGSTKVTKDDKKALLEALAKGVSESKGEAAKCFNPRHGLKATHDGKTAELVICFECLQIEAFSGDKKAGYALTTAGPQKAFDKVLTDAKVPLPKAK